MAIGVGGRCATPVRALGSLKIAPSGRYPTTTGRVCTNARLSRNMYRYRTRARVLVHRTDPAAGPVVVAQVRGVRRSSAAVHVDVGRVSDTRVEQDRGGPVRDGARRRHRARQRQLVEGRGRRRVHVCRAQRNRTGIALFQDKRVRRTVRQGNANRPRSGRQTAGRQVSCGRLPDRIDRLGTRYDGGGQPPRHKQSVCRTVKTALRPRPID